MRNHGPLKNIMDQLNVATISESALAELLPLWKNYPQLHVQLQSEALGAGVLLRWIANVVEFRLKKEALSSTQSKVKEVLCASNLVATEHSQGQASTRY
jgi:hypothetical protein